MKKIALIFCLFLAAAGAFGQHEILIHLSPRMGNEAFKLNKAVNHPSGNYQLKFTRFEYYITGIKITHDGGQVDTLDALVFLARPEKDSMFSLGILPGIETVEGLSFCIGVDPARNHLDPASYPAGHPLAPQNPAMQWGWTAGYRFAAIEGVAGTNFSQTFEVHALGDANYKPTILASGAELTQDNRLIIHAVADYLEVMRSIDVSGGLIFHGANGSASLLLNNFRNLVFSTESMSAVVTPAFAGQFSVQPNPVISGLPRVLVSLPQARRYELVATDLSGKIWLRKNLTPGANQSVELSGLNGGVYLVGLYQDGKPVAVSKLIVLD